MAQNRILQLLRSNDVYASKDAAKSAVQALTGRKDGEILLARYYNSTTETSDVKSLLCVYHMSPNLTGVNPGWTFIEDASSNTDSTAKLQNEVDAIETAVGLTGAGAYQTNASGDTAQVMTGAQTDGTAPTTVMGAVENVATYITTLDADVNQTASVDDSKIITGVGQVNGQVAATAAELSSVKVASVIGTEAKIAAEDTLGTALGKLQAQIEAMDLSEVGGTSGDVITAVSEADGKVSASSSPLTDVVMTGYAADTTKTGAIAETDTLEQAFNKLENSIAANDVHSNDQSITVAADSTNGGTNIEVKVDGATIVKDGTSHALKSGLTLAKITTGLGTNVKEAYQLQNASGVQIGDQIDIYKDSALKEVYLGASTDTIDTSTGTITKNTVTDPQSMNFAYQLADGTYSLTKIDVSKFLTESEFSDGLQVSGSVVSVKKDANSGKVRTAADVLYTAEDAEVIAGTAQVGQVKTSGLVDVLTVSSNGVKVDNIQDAINYGVKNASTSLAVTAEGDDYVSASVNANTDNKHVVVATNVQDLTATAGTPGVYNASTGAQETAPVAGSLSGVEDSLGDASDIASKVKTYVDGAIAIEAARGDAKNKADLKAAVEALDGNATATAADANTGDFSVLTKVNEVDGVVQAVGNGATNSKEVLLKKVAATGAAEDVTVAADQTSGLVAGNVQDTLEALKTSIDGGLDSVSSGNGAIAVGTKSNKNQSISLVIAPHTAGTDQNPATEANDMLSVTANGLSLSNVWDCGTY